MDGIHQSGILHNDVHPENFVIKRDSQQFRVAFIDFAFATEISKIEECEKEMDILTTILGIPVIRTKGKHQNSLLEFSSLNPYQDTADTVVRAPEHFRLEDETPAWVSTIVPREEIPSAVTVLARRLPPTLTPTLK